MRNGCRRGLTVAELIVASGLLGILVVTLMVMFGQMMAASTKNSLLSAGSYFAETILEREKSRALRLAEQGNTDVFQNLPDDGSEWITTHDESHQTEFRYRVNARKLNDVPNLGENWYVEVEVSWWQDGGTQDTKVGFGKLNVRRGRVVYVQIDS